MHFSLTPTYKSLQEIKSLNTKSLKTRFFIDFRNALPVFFNEHLIEIMVKDSLLSISQLIQSTIEFMNFTDQCLDEKCEYVFFYDSGKSRYHNSISKGQYKEARRASTFNLPDDVLEASKKINNAVLDLFFELSKKFPRVYTIKLNYLESDFVPHFIINVLEENKQEYLNIILTNDKDMLQTIKPNNNTYVLRKRFVKNKTTNSREVVESLITFDDIYTTLLKKDFSIDSNENFIADILAVAGDEADGIKGLHRVGYIKAAKIFQKHKKHLPDIINEHLEDSFVEHKDLLLNNYKLTSFDELISNLSVSAIQDITLPLNKQKIVSDIEQYSEVLSSNSIHIDREVLQTFLSDSIQPVVYHTQQKQADLKDLIDYL